MDFTLAVFVILGLCIVSLLCLVLPLQIPNSLLIKALVLVSNLLWLFYFLRLQVFSSRHNHTFPADCHMIK